MLLGIMSAVAMLAGLSAAFDAGFSNVLWILWSALAFLGAMLVQLGIFFLVVWIAACRVDMEKEQERESKFYRFLVDQIVAAGVPLLGVRIHAHGLEQTPREGRFLLVCNHIYDLDPVILLACFKKNRLAFISKRENDQKFIAGPIMRKILCQSINRENDREALKTILKCIQIIKEDKVSIAVFPEGYIMPDRLLRPLKPGVFKIAQKAGVPIVVCTLRGTPLILKNAKRLRPTDVELRLLQVLDAETVRKANTVDLAHRVYELMAQDLGPELVYTENT